MPSGDHTDPEQRDSLHPHSRVSQENSWLLAPPPPAHVLKPSCHQEGYPGAQQHVNY